MAAGYLVLDPITFRGRESARYVLTAVGFLSLTVAADAQTSASVSVPFTVTVHALADISFPDGFDFLIHVPRNASPRGATIQPVRIPFTVNGNASASVSVKPDVFLKISGNSYRGRALGPNGGNEELGYDIVVQFPVPSKNYHGLPGRGGFGTHPSHHGMANLPFTDGQGTQPMTTDLATRNFTAYGTIHIVARHDWTKDGKFATYGDYAGSIEVTIIAD